MTRRRAAGMAVRHAVSEEIRYSRMALGLSRIGADLRSRCLLALLGLPGVAHRQGHSGRRVAVRIRLGGRAFPIALRGRMDLEVLHEIAIDDEYGATDAVPAAVIVDLGAHIGLSSLRLLAGHPQAQIVAVEADPELAELLADNVRGLPVTVVNAAVAATSGQREFFRSLRSGWSNSLSRVSADQESIHVATVSWADLLRTHGIEHVDLLKIDVEGAEWELFAGGVPPEVGSIVGELHAVADRPASDLLATVGSGRDVRIVRSDSEQVVFLATPADEERQA